MEKYTIEDEIIEARRATSAMVKGYPKWIRDGIITQAEATKRIFLFTKIVARLERIQEQMKVEQTHLFNKQP